MPVLAPETIADLLQPYVACAAIPQEVYVQLACYLELILKWNARINLTAIRQPEAIVRRHFGESLFAGLHLNSKNTCDSLLDLGSGAGFPGIPIQLLYPNLLVTLAESRSRKAAFLQEVTRVLGLKTEVWAARAETMPPERRFHTVALRAVDEMDSAIAEAARRVSHRILILGTRNAAYPTLPASFSFAEPISFPGFVESVLWIAEQTNPA